MADRRIADLDEATVLTDNDLFVLSQSNQAKKTTWARILNYLATALDGHGGISSITKVSSLANVDTYRITYADSTVSSFTVTNGKEISAITQYWAVSSSASTVPSEWSDTRQEMTATYRYLWSYVRYTYNDNTYEDMPASVVGVYGDTGDDWYVHIRYSANRPTSDEQISPAPNNWMGVYSGTSVTAPTDYTQYDWFQIKGAKGDTGNGILSVIKSGTSGLNDTYTITFSNNTQTTFTVTNGSKISSIERTNRNGLIDTYTVSMTDGTTSTFTVTNAKSISSITPVDVTRASGHTDVYRINYNDGDTYEFSIYNGVNGTGAVSTVDGIISSNQDVALLTLGSTPPTTATAGNLKSRYFDTASSRLYICVGIDNSGAEPTYTWAGAGVTVDSTFSTTSENPVKNSVLTAAIGPETLTTQATTLRGAVNELKSGLDSKVSSIKATNVTVATTDWITDPDSTSSDFPKRAAITMAGVTASMFPQVAFDVDDALSGNYAPIAQCGAGVVYIYASEIPSSAITIPSVCVTV